MLRPLEFRPDLRLENKGILPPLRRVKCRVLQHPTPYQHRAHSDIVRDQFAQKAVPEHGRSPVNKRRFHRRPNRNHHPPAAGYHSKFPTVADVYLTEYVVGESAGQDVHPIPNTSA